MSVDLPIVPSKCWSSRLRPRQREVLEIIIDHDSECWGDVWSHCHWPGPPALAFANFDRVASSLVRRGFVSEGDRLTITDAGRAVLGASHER